MDILRKLTGNFVETEVDGEVLLVDMDGGELFAMDGTAREIWRALDGGIDRQGLIERMAARYGGDGEGVIARDCERLLAELAEAGLIAPAGAAC